MPRRSLLSVAVVAPNLDKAVRRYDAEFMRESIVNPGAYIEKGQGGSIGGKEPYGTEMPAYGPRGSRRRSGAEQQVADPVAFVMQGEKKGRVAGRRGAELEP